MIRVLVNGALGRMGGEVCKKVFAEPDLELVGAVDIKEGTIALGEGVPVSTDLVAAIEATKPQVVVDFTRPDVVMDNLRKMLPLGVHAVVGTTGFKDADLQEVDALARANNTSLLIAPNEIASVTKRFIRLSSLSTSDMSIACLSLSISIRSRRYFGAVLFSEAALNCLKAS